MDIQRALKLKKGSLVNCPADRGDPAFTGKIVTETEMIKNAIINTHPNGGKYIWIEIQTPFLHKSVWPSNRLG